jgi:hypothetical protein
MTDTQNNYRNPFGACAPRVNNIRFQKTVLVTQVWQKSRLPYNSSTILWLTTNFRMVQNIAFFADRLSAMNTRIMKLKKRVIHAIHRCGCILDVEKVWKLKPRKYLLKSQHAIPRNFAPPKISRYILLLILLFQKKCVGIGDLPFHVQQGERKGRSVEDGK